MHVVFLQQTAGMVFSQHCFHQVANTLSQLAKTPLKTMSYCAGHSSRCLHDKGKITVLKPITRGRSSTHSGHLFHGGNAADAGKAAVHPSVLDQAVQHLPRCIQVEAVPRRLFISCTWSSLYVYEYHDETM